MFCVLHTWLIVAFDSKCCCIRRKEKSNFSTYSIKLQRYRHRKKHTFFNKKVTQENVGKKNAFVCFLLSDTDATFSNFSKIQHFFPLSSKVAGKQTYHREKKRRKMLQFHTFTRKKENHAVFFVILLRQCLNSNFFEAT